MKLYTLEHLSLFLHIDVDKKSFWIRAQYFIVFSGAVKTLSFYCNKHLHITEYQYNDYFPSFPEETTNLHQYTELYDSTNSKRSLKIYLSQSLEFHTHTIEIEYSLNEIIPGWNFFPNNIHSPISLKKLESIFSNSSNSFLKSEPSSNQYCYTSSSSLSSLNNSLWVPLLQQYSKCSIYLTASNFYDVIVNGELKNVITDENSKSYHFSISNLIHVNSIFIFIGKVRRYEYKNDKMLLKIGIIDYFNEKFFIPINTIIQCITHNEQILNISYPFNTLYFLYLNCYTNSLVFPGVIVYDLSQLIRNDTLSDVYNNYNISNNLLYNLIYDISLSQLLLLRIKYYDSLFIVYGLSGYLFLLFIRKYYNINEYHYFIYYINLFILNNIQKCHIPIRNVAATVNDSFHNLIDFNQLYNTIIPVLSYNGYYFYNNSKVFVYRSILAFYHLIHYIKAYKTSENAFNHVVQNFYYENISTTKTFKNPIKSFFSSFSSVCNNNFDYTTFLSSFVENNIFNNELYVHYIPTKFRNNIIHCIISKKSTLHSFSINFNIHYADNTISKTKRTFLSLKEDDQYQIVCKLKRMAKATNIEMNEETDSTFPSNLISNIDDYNVFLSLLNNITDIFNMIKVNEMSDANDSIKYFHIDSIMNNIVSVKYDIPLLFLINIVLSSNDIILILNAIENIILYNNSEYFNKYLVLLYIINNSNIYYRVRIFALISLCTYPNKITYLLLLHYYNYLFSSKDNSKSSYIFNEDIVLYNYQILIPYFLSFVYINNETPFPIIELILNLLKEYDHTNHEYISYLIKSAGNIITTNRNLQLQLLNQIKRFIRHDSIFNCSSYDLLSISIFNIYKFDFINGIGNLNYNAVVDIFDASASLNLQCGLIHTMIELLVGFGTDKTITTNIKNLYLSQIFSILESEDRPYTLKYNTILLIYQVFSTTKTNLEDYAKNDVFRERILGVMLKNSYQNEFRYLVYLFFHCVFHMNK